MSGAGGNEVRQPALVASTTSSRSAPSASASRSEMTPAVDESVEDTKTAASSDGVGCVTTAALSTPAGAAGTEAADEATAGTSRWTRGRVVLADATAAAAAPTAEGRSDALMAVAAVLEKHPMTLDESTNAIRSTGGGNSESSIFFNTIAHSDNIHIARARAEVFADALPPRKMADACTDGFAATIATAPTATTEATIGAQHTTRRSLMGLSVFFAYGARTEPRDLIELAKVLTLEELKDCFLGGVSFVDNPFIPGVSLSVALKKALKNTAESERPVLATLHEKLDDLLLEVLERLPQTMSEFPGGADACQAIFEPEAAGLRDKRFLGPLRLVMQERHFSETLCVSPLVFEYMSHRFVAGLPNIYDTNDLLGRRKTSTALSNQRGTVGRTVSSEGHGREGREFLYSNGFVAGSTLGKAMQGLGWTGKTFPKRSRDWERVFRGTVVPGAQFVTIGVVTKPLVYYKVPAMRMVFGFYVHLIMLALYTAVVLEDDDGELSETEMFLTFHVVAEIVNNLLQMRANFFEYLKDKWNWLECLSLSLLAGGLFIRVVDSDVHLGRALFALSAPLVFSRVLFFGQALQRQGVVIQMMAIMFGEMLHFGLVLGTIMMGFTVSFFALFGESQSYDVVWLNVFKAMLGEVNAFDELYEDSVYRDVARLLLVVYLIVVAVMLLNLLIAVLSTEHAKVEQQQDRAFRESKVRIMKQYSREVDGDLLPSPFNLVQLALWLLASAVDRLFHLDTCPKITQKFGVGVFWLMLGPPAVLVAWGLWLVSIPEAVLKVVRRTTFSGRSLTFALVCSSTVVVFHAIGLPLVVVWFWVRSGVGLLVLTVKELLASLCGNNGDNDGGREEGEGSLTSSGRRRVGHPRDGAGGTAGVVSDASATATAAPAATVTTSGGGAATVDTSSGAPASPFLSVAEVLEQMDSLPGASRREGGSLNVAKIRAYLEDPATTDGLAGRQKEQGQTATREDIVKMRNRLDIAGKEQGDAILARLASVDADLQRKIAELEESVARSVEGLLQRGGRFEESLGTLIGEQVARAVEKSLAPVKEKLTPT